MKTFVNCNNTFSLFFNKQSSPLGTELYFYATVSTFKKTKKATGHRTKRACWGQFNRTFTRVVVFLDSASNSFTCKLPLVVISFLRSGALVSG